MGGVMGVRRTFRVWCAISLVMLLPACAARMLVTPEIEASTNAEVQLLGQIMYDGNREYLPRTIATASSDPAGLELRYTYDVRHGRDSIPQLLPLFNPLSLVGFPIGEDTLTVEGRLEIVRGTEVMKAYTAACILESSRNLFWPGETYSEMRRKGLVAVRDNIEMQMRRDRTYLSTLSTGR
jgi:hypothetical protein